VLDTLLERGELAEVETRIRDNARGRPSRQFRRTSLLPPVVLIELDKDVGTTVSLVDADGIAADRLVAARWDAPWPRWSATLKRLVRELVRGAPTPPRLAVISAPFPVRDGAGQPRVHPLPANSRALPKVLPPQSDWLSADPRPPVAELLGYPVVLVNDANLAALGEARAGAGQPYRAVVHLSVRAGIGAGFVFDQALFTGANGFAGELAHVQVVDHHGEFCVCGGRGCLATMTRGPSVLDALNDIYDADLTFDELTELIDQRDAIAVRFFKDLGALVGRPLGILVTALDPDCVVVDAGLGSAVGPFIDGLGGELAHRCPPELLSRLALVPGLLPDAIAAGAIAAANAATRG
jgi:predicted NBD/HSP70 family sugar kinase